MDIKSTNNVGDMMLVSCGNDDDSRILIHDLNSRTVVQEIKKEIYGFYNMNIIVFEHEQDQLELDQIEQQQDQMLLESEPKLVTMRSLKMQESSKIQNSISHLPSILGPISDKERMGEQIQTQNAAKINTEGLAIIVAGISNIKLFVYDFVEKMIAVEEDLDIHGDIGSYLNVMEIIKRPKKQKESEEIETYNLFMGCTEGDINIFELKLKFNYYNPVLGEMGDELRAAGKEIMRRQTRIQPADFNPYIENDDEENNDDNDSEEGFDNI